LIVAMATSLAAGAALIGFAAAQARVRALEAPRLTQELQPTAVTGWVTAVERGQKQPRLVLRVKEIEGLSEAPRYVRLSTPVAFGPGRAVRCFGVLRPPQPPLAPYAFDSERRAFFQRIGASGFTFGACRAIVLPQSSDALLRLQLWLGAVRRDVAEAITTAAPGRGGAVAATLVTGDMSLLDAETDAAFRDSGLGHLLSVSGLHMSLVGGMAFAAALVGFGAIPGLALRAPVRKLAAMAAILAATAYLGLSGASLPAQRAWIMILVAFGAIVLDRAAITMRGLAFAALLITLAQPEAVLDPGFQMSFAATAALVALFESHWGRIGRDPLPAPGPIIGALQNAQGALAATLITSLVAGLTIDPFVFYHFQRFSMYGLPANLAASPIITLVVAPAAGVAAALAPFGLAEFPLKVMAWGLDLVTSIGAMFAVRPEAVQTLPRMSDGAFLLCVAGVTWACLWRGTLRWFALAPLLAAAGWSVIAKPPVLWADGEFKTVLARDAGERWILVKPARGGDFAISRLGGLAGLHPLDVAEIPPPDRCGATACWQGASGGRYFRVSDPAGFANACVNGAVVLATAPPPRPDWAQSCTVARLIMPRPSQGGLAIWQDEVGDLHVQWAREAGRPWSQAVIQSEGAED
jgi:competence protein ComEC